VCSYRRTLSAGGWLIHTISQTVGGRASPVACPTINSQNWSTGATCACDEEIKKDREKNFTVQWKTRYSPRAPTLCNQNTVWRGGWSSGSSYKFQVSSTSAERWSSCEGSKFGWFWLFSLLRPMAYTTAVLLYGCDYLEKLLIDWGVQLTWFSLSEMSPAPWTELWTGLHRHTQIHTQTDRHTQRVTETQTQRHMHSEMSQAPWTSLYAHRDIHIHRAATNIYLQKFGNLGTSELVKRDPKVTKKGHKLTQNQMTNHITAPVHDHRNQELWHII